MLTKILNQTQENKQAKIQADSSQYNEMLKEIY